MKIEQASIKHIDNLLTASALENSHREVFVNKNIHGIQQLLFEKIYNIRQNTKGSKYLLNKEIEKVKVKNVISLIEKDNKYTFKNDESLGLYKGWNSANCEGDLYFTIVQSHKKAKKSPQWKPTNINKKYFGEPISYSEGGFSKIFKPGASSQLKYKNNF